jgi:hypothetical protein
MSYLRLNKSLVCLNTLMNKRPLEMQLNDVQNLLKTVQGLDKAYIHNWVEALGLSQVYKRVNYDA